MEDSINTVLTFSTNQFEFSFICVWKVFTHYFVKRSDFFSHCPIVFSPACGWWSIFKPVLISLCKNSISQNHRGRHSTVEKEGALSLFYRFVSGNCDHIWRKAGNLPCLNKSLFTFLDFKGIVLKYFLEINYSLSKMHSNSINIHE